MTDGGRMAGRGKMRRNKGGITEDWGRQSITFQNQMKKYKQKQRTTKDNTQTEREIEKRGRRREEKEEDSE